MNYWYLNIYVLWMNTILNIVLPIVSLVVLNILVSNIVLYLKCQAGENDVQSQVSRRIEAHLRSLDSNQAAAASARAHQRHTRQVKI